MRDSVLSFALLVGLVCLSGCAITPKVHTDYDPSQSFANYQSFAWISDNPMMVTGDQGPSPLAAKRLQTAIRTALTDKGFKFVAQPSAADFVVSFTVGARDKLEIRERQVNDYYGEHWRWGYDYFAYAYPRNFPSNRPRTEVTTREYSEGSLAIDIFDAQRKSPVWHGSASKRLTRAELEGKGAESTKAAVQTLLQNFPPQ